MKEKEIDEARLKSENVYLLGALSADRDKDATLLSGRVCWVYW